MSNFESLYGKGKLLGYYSLNNIYQLAIYGKKPNWFHRTMMRVCFGIKWIDNKE